MRAAFKHRTITMECDHPGCCFRPAHRRDKLSDRRGKGLLLGCILLLAFVGPTQTSRGRGHPRSPASESKGMMNMWAGADWRPMRVRGGSAATREQMELRMREERAKVAAEEERIIALQEKKKRDREEANRMALVTLEVEDERKQLVRMKRQRLPETPTLTDLTVYGKEMVAEGDTGEAMLAYSRVLAIDPTDSDALLNLAVLYQDQHEINTAEEMLQRAVEADPQMLGAWMRLARVHLLRRSETNMYGTQDEELIKQRDASAEECLRKALTLEPANADVLTGLGSILWHFKRDADGAQEMFSRAVQFNPLTPEPFSAYAAFLDEVKKDTSGAQVLYRRAAQLAPADNGILWELATFLHHKAANLTAAEQVYTGLLARTPDDSAVVSEYAELLVSANRSSDAHQLYKRVLALAPDEPDLLHQYGGLMLHEQGDRLAASRLFEMAATINPSHAPTLITLGEMLAHENSDWAASEAMFSRAMLADPSNSMAVSPGLGFGVWGRWQSVGAFVASCGWV